MQKFLFLCFTFIFASTVNAQQWDTIVTGSTADFYSVAISNSSPNGFAVGKDHTTLIGQIIFTTNYGATWTTATLPYTSAPGFNAATYSNTLDAWAVSDSGKVFHSPDFGNTWQLVSKISSENLYSIFFFNSGFALAGGENGVLYRSEDGGYSWDTLNSGTVLDIHAICFTSAAKGWITGNGGYIATTSDSGNTWTQISNQPYFGFYNGRGIAVAGTKTYSVGNYGFAIQSVPPDTMWTSLNSLSTTENLNDIVFHDTIGGLICGGNGSIFRTHDGGLSWTQDSVTAVTQNLFGIAFGDTFALICGANGRMLRNHINNVTSVNDVAAGRISASAFPNPFDDQLNIAIDLSENSNVQVFVFDVSGRMLVNENEGDLPAGKHFVQLQEISSLNSGMYFTKIVAGENSIVVPVVKR